MSFSDFTSPSSSKKTTQSSTITSSSSTGLSTDESSSSNNSGSKALTIISDALLQYQRNVGILEKIVQLLSTSTNQSTLNESIVQYEAQNHVLIQLEEKLKQLLIRQQYPSIQQQTAITKLKRDYERVQQRVVQLQETATMKISFIQQEAKKTSSTNTNSNNITNPFFLNTSSTNNIDVENDIIQQHYQQQQLQIQEDRLQEEIMREREEEIKNINRGMHTVNEIYKDLAHLVSQQQHDIDTIETQMEDSRNNAEHGLQQVEKANEKYGQGTCQIM